MHAICNMLGDGLVPSNSKAGYLVRMLSRRVCKMKDELSIDLSLAELGGHHMDENMDFSTFVQNREEVLSILLLEEKRYYEMLRKGESAVRTALQDLPTESIDVPDEILFRLSEERGLNPEMVVSIAKTAGWKDLVIRVGFAADMASRNAERTKLESKAKTRKKIFPTQGISPTIKDYYDDTLKTKFEASLIMCDKLSTSQLKEIMLSPEVTQQPSHFVISDRTLFYPEGGGQMGDQGSIGGVKVVDTKIEDGVIIHLTVGPTVDKKLYGEVDWIRRKQLMDHHTAIHIVGGSARKLLGPHIWQAGSSKGARYARIDLTHHSRISQEEMEAIEEDANSIIIRNETIEKALLTRSEADLTYGFELYQGGPPKFSEIRVVKIGDHDVQACGGTHHDHTGKIGEIRIIRTSQVQDGVERLQIVAGETSREHARNQERILQESSEVLGVSADDLPAAVRRFFQEWKSQQKKIESLEAEIIRLRTTGGGDGAVVVNGIRYAIMEISGDMKSMMSMLSELTRDKTVPTVAILGTKEGGGKLIVACTEDTEAARNHNALEILNKISTHINGGGGGGPTMAQGGGSKPDGIPAALAEARVLLGL